MCPIVHLIFFLIKALISFVFASVSWLIFHLIICLSTRESRSRLQLVVPLYIVALFANFLHFENRLVADPLKHILYIHLIPQQQK